MQAPNKFD
jgi:hypothetical protein